MRATLKEVPALVRERRVFNANGTLFAMNSFCRGLYGVFSYGEHFPVAVYVHDLSRWFVNKDEYSRATTRHQSEVLAGVPSDAVTLSRGDIVRLFRYRADMRRLTMNANLYETARWARILWGDPTLNERNGTHEPDIRHT